jgi:hypothetical protein
MIVLDKKIIKKRTEICKSCEHLVVGSTCNICVCPIFTKVRVKNTSCPIGKWKEVDD